MFSSGLLDGTPHGSTEIHPSPDIAMPQAGLHTKITPDYVFHP
jgi:hypothetical protein